MGRFVIFWKFQHYSQKYLKGLGLPFFSSVRIFLAKTVFGQFPWDFKQLTCFINLFLNFFLYMSYCMYNCTWRKEKWSHATLRMQNSAHSTAIYIYVNKYILRLCCAVFLFFFKLGKRYFRWDCLNNHIAINNLNK